MLMQSPRSSGLCLSAVFSIWAYSPNSFWIAAFLKSSEIRFQSLEREDFLSQSYRMTSVAICVSAIVLLDGPFYLLLFQKSCVPQEQNSSVGIKGCIE